jgi:hypothetical protein
MSRKPPAGEIERLRLENEELLESRRLADEARDRYLDLYDHLPLAHLTLDGVGIIRELNEDALELLGGGEGDGRPRGDAAQTLDARGRPSRAGSASARRSGGA